MDEKHEEKDETSNVIGMVFGFLIFVATIAFNVWIVYLLWQWLFG